jgi:hypothetical protein
MVAVEVLRIARSDGAGDSSMNERRVTRRMGNRVDNISVDCNVGRATSKLVLCELIRKRKGKVYTVPTCRSRSCGLNEGKHDLTNNVRYEQYRNSHPAAIDSNFNEPSPAGNKEACGYMT